MEIQNIIVIVGIMLLLGFIVLFFIVKSENNKNKIKKIQENTNKNIPTPISNIPMCTVMGGLEDKEDTDILKNTIDKVTEKSKEIKIGNILVGLKGNAEQKEDKVHTLAKRIKEKKVFTTVKEEVDFWIMIEREIDKMTDQERDELQQFINSKTKNNG